RPTRPGSCSAPACRSCSPRAPTRCAAAWPPARSRCSTPTRVGATPRCRPCERKETTMDTVLVVNAGSSSVKFQLYGTAGAGDLDRLVKGQMDGIRVRARLRASGADGKALVDQSFSTQEVPDLPAAMLKVGAWLRETQKVTLIAVGHRVVHGGPDYDRAIMVDDAVIARLERYVPLAPLHQPNNLAPIRSIRANNPQLPQVACFDTAFHRGHSA